MTKLACLFILLFASHAFAFGESGPDNGTDYVKVLFAEARQDLVQNLANVHAADVSSMKLDADVSTWLLATTNGVPNIEGVKAYMSSFDLRFQTAPCEDSHERQSTICFLWDAGKPVVLVSLAQNRLTTSDQAMAMLIHECGHFVGQMDHLFLDRVGVELVAQIAPQVLEVTRSSKEVSADPQTGKTDCEAGTSSQARALARLAALDLQAQCSDHHWRCDFLAPVFTGEAEWVEGQGFTMNVICSVRQQAKH